MREVDYTAAKCPACGEYLSPDIVVTVDGSPPAPGDWTICRSCTATLRVGEDFTIQIATAGEESALPEEDRALLELLRRAVERSRRRRQQRDGA